MIGVKSIFRGVLPSAILHLLASSPLPAAATYLRYRTLLCRNRVLHRRHSPGQRAFVLCNGPSINRQDILPLKDEFVISVSSGYLIDNYKTISPQYHCVPQITYGLVKEQDVVEWFTEMHAHLGDAELFLSLSEYELVKKHGLFAGRNVYYLCLGRAFRDTERSIPDLSSVIPSVASVPIMALMVAMYLGFEHINLLGVDHDSFKTGNYTYAFQPTVLRGKDSSVNEDGSIKVGIGYLELQALARLWLQYRQLKLMAESAGVKIWNATDGGLLDVFDRVNLEHLWDRDI